MWAVVGFILLVCASSHDHLFQVSDPSLLTPHSRKLSEHAHSAEHERHTLHYSAVQHPRHTLRLLEPQLAPLITAIHCNETHVTIHLDEHRLSEAMVTLSDRFEIGAVCSGACIDLATGADEPRPFYRTAQAMHADLPRRELHLQASPTSLHAAFDTLNLKVRVLPGGVQPQSNPAEAGDIVDGVGRRRLFFNRIPGIGDVKGALNELGEGIRDAAGTLIDIGGRLIGGVSGIVDDASGDVGDALDGFAESASSAVQSAWETAVGALGGARATVNNLFSGFEVRESVSTTLFELNYDKSTGRAKNRSMPFFHTPWATCDECFFNGNISAALEIGFEAGAVPTRFHAEVGAALKGRVSLKVNAPTPAAVNDMGNWHAIVPRAHLGTFNFVVGYVPVRIDLYLELNAAAWTDSPDIAQTVELSAGVQASVEARLGVHWSAADGWRKIQDLDYNTSYWLPSLTDGALDASVRAMVSPEVIMVVWQAAPLEVKPKLLLVWQGANAGLPCHVAVLLLSLSTAALTVMHVRHASLPGMARRRAGSKHPRAHPLARAAHKYGREHASFASAPHGAPKRTGGPSRPAKC
uniref:Lipid-binding serum glycoprotein N-terminal domain-containing protein n=1 Tax=Haptolina brevifila TaxID=156173 RepID=A0A7S2NA07_9EUKA|mmetsp:Transcript_71111/g.140970  ORF Transcript_71111/g.140970 Transcript_71111/m.140970 type:complete len:581 (+) Transcript_71111:137-1879(+)